MNASLETCQITDINNKVENVYSSKRDITDFGKFPAFDRMQHASAWTGFAKILHKQTMNVNLEKCPV